MTSLWSVAGDNVHVSYKNMRDDEAELQLKANLEAMWAKFEPYAADTFVKQFSQDPDAFFWEMYLGNCLLDDGRTLLSAAQRAKDDCLPDLCVVDGENRIWIEAIAPDEGSGENKVVGPKPLNEGGGFAPAPVRQGHLRMTGALWEKSKKLTKYVDKKVISENEVRLIAINVGRFGLYVQEDPPAILSAVFPIGDEYVTVDKQSGEVIDWGYRHSASIDKKGAKDPIPRTAFIDETFSHVSGIVWSRASIGNYARAQRPLTLVHNPMATIKQKQGWGTWDKEYVAEKVEEGWLASNLKAAKKDAET